MRPALLALVLVTACRIEPTSTRADGPFHDGAPNLLGLTFICDQDNARWRLNAETDAWSGGGVLYMTRDGVEVERHSVSSDFAAGDGTWDCLALSLGQAADRDDAASGSTSRWLCRDASDLSFLFAVANTDNTDWTDCRVWGEEPEIWADVVGVPGCDQTVYVNESGVVDDAFDQCL